MISEELSKIYGNKIRVRVCGVLTFKDKILMVNHSGLNSDNIFWNFPGGGVEHGESLQDALKREFKEETNIDITVDKMVLMNQIIKKPLHGIELYFNVNANFFNEKLGFDPEINIISEIRWFTLNEVQNLPNHHKPDFMANFKTLNALIFNNEG
ncbi:NUDIX hydrolase [Lacihabitans sp. LS3-19]|uniref:NUDIX domain-containing protein n=1 Tax=Lacihabitans sp. LS3-19 TaxID=2487335 RepID=UPI0020CC8AFB|nr:NUDIX hydrolase [Lacihabitans sp. LS3-19]MCP9767600.1 NUDIX hydrolase [Lacihabitans sp. LS3-19]